MASDSFNAARAARRAAGAAASQAWLSGPTIRASASAMRAFSASRWAASDAQAAASGMPVRASSSASWISNISASSAGGAFGFTAAPSFVSRPSSSRIRYSTRAIGSRSARYAAFTRAEASSARACSSGGAAWWKSGCHCRDSS